MWECKPEKLRPDEIEYLKGYPNGPSTSMTAPFLKVIGMLLNHIEALEQEKGGDHD